MTPVNIKTANTTAISIPAALGSIKESWTGAKSKSTIIHIQDAHCNYFAQTKIAEIIKYLNDNYGVNTINLEGGAKNYDLSLFTGIKDKVVREKTVDHFVKEGVLNGAEYFAANNPQKVSLWGIEDTKLYIENLRVYRDSLAYKADVDKSLKNLNYALSNLKTKIYSKELLELDRKANAYKEKSTELKDYIAYLINLAKSKDINLSDFANIGILSRTTSLEPGIDFKKANAERDDLVDRLTKLLSRVEVKELVEKAVEFKLGRLMPLEFYSYLTAKSKELRINLDVYKNLTLYIEYTQLYSTIKNDQLFKELSILEERVTEKLYQNPAQRELNKLSKNLAIIKNIFGITLTPNEYRYYASHRDEFRMENYMKFVNSQAPLHGFNFRLGEDIIMLDGYLEKIEKFYVISLKRDDAFLKNIKPKGQGKNTVILITGGFHSENLAELFKKNNISYISIMPNFKNEDGYVCPYFDLLSGKKKIILAKEVQKLTAQALAYCSPNTILAEEVNGSMANVVIPPSGAGATKPAIIEKAAQNRLMPNEITPIRKWSIEKIENPLFAKFLKYQEVMSATVVIAFLTVLAITPILLNVSPALKQAGIAAMAGGIIYLYANQIIRMILHRKLDVYNESISLYLYDKNGNYFKYTGPVYDEHGHEKKGMHLFSGDRDINAEVNELAKKHGLKNILITSCNEGNGKIGQVDILCIHANSRAEITGIRFKPALNRGVMSGDRLYSEKGWSLVLPFGEEVSLSEAWDKGLLGNDKKASLPPSGVGAATDIQAALDTYIQRIRETWPMKPVMGSQAAPNRQYEKALLDAYRELMSTVQSDFTRRDGRNGVYIYPLRGPDLILHMLGKVLSIEKSDVDYYQAMHKFKNEVMYGPQVEALIKANDAGDSLTEYRDALEAQNYIVKGGEGATRTLVLKGFTTFLLSYNFKFGGEGLLEKQKELLREVLVNIDRVIVLDKRDCWLINEIKKAGFNVTGPEIGNLFKDTDLAGEDQIDVTCGEFMDEAPKNLTLPTAFIMLEKKIEPAPPKVFPMLKTLTKSAVMAGFACLFYYLGVPALSEMINGEPTTLNIVNGIFSASMLMIATTIAAKGFSDILIPTPGKRISRDSRRGFFGSILQSIAVYGLAGGLIEAMNRADKPSRYAATVNDRMNEVAGLTSLYSKIGFDKIHFVSRQKMYEIAMDAGYSDEDSRRIDGLTLIDSGEVYVAVPGQDKKIIDFSTFTDRVLKDPNFDADTRRNVLRTAYHEGFHAIMGKSRRQKISMPIIKTSDWVLTGKPFVMEVFGGKNLDKISSGGKIDGDNTPVEAWLKLYRTLRGEYKVYVGTPIPYEEVGAYVLGALSVGGDILELSEAEQKQIESQVLNGDQIEMYLNRLAMIFLQSLKKEQFEGLLNYYAKFGIEVKIPQFLWNKFYWQPNHNARAPGVPEMAAAFFAGKPMDEAKATNKNKLEVDEKKPLPTTSANALDVSLDEAVRAAEAIIQNSSIASQEENMIVLSGTLRDLFQDGFNKGLLNDPDLTEFFKPKEGVELKDQPISMWTNGNANNSLRIEKMLKKLCGVRPDLSDNLAKICCAIGTIYYCRNNDPEKRNYIYYSRSELFYRMAHEIDEITLGPDQSNLYYHNNWARALSHCGPLGKEEARREFEILVEKSASRSGRGKPKYLVEIGNIDLDARTAPEIRAFGSGASSDLREDQFAQRTSSLESGIIGAVLGLERSKKLREYPRTLYTLAKAYRLLCALNKFKAEYILAHLPLRVDEARELSIRIMSNSRDALRNAFASSQKAGRTLEQEQHAESILVDTAKATGSALRQWRTSVMSFGLFFGDYLPLLKSSAEKLNTAIRSLPPNISADLEAQLMPAMDMIALQEFIINCLKEELRACGENDAENIEQFFSSIKARIKEKIEERAELAGVKGSVSGLVDGAVDFYRAKLNMDKADLIIIYVCCHVLARPDERIPDEIAANADILMEGLSRQEWTDRIEKLSDFLGLDISRPVKTEPEPKVPQKKKPVISKVDTIDIMHAAGLPAKGKGYNFVDKISELRAEFDILIEWDGKLSDVSLNYTIRLKTELENLETDVRRFREDAAKDNTNDGLKASHGKLKNRLESMEELLAARRAHIINAAGRIVKEVTKQYNICKDMLRDIKYEWVRDELQIIDDELKNLSDILDEKKEDHFLSYVIFKDLTMTIDLKLRKLNNFALKIETLKPLFTIIEEAEREANLYNMLFKKQPFIDVLMATLKERREDLFIKAYNGTGIDGVSEMEKEFYEESIKRRTRYLAIIRKSIRGAIESIDTSEYVGSGKAACRELKIVTAEIDNIIKNDFTLISDPSNHDDIIRSIFNINLALPVSLPRSRDQSIENDLKADAITSPVVDRMAMHFAWKIKMLFGSMTTASRVGWDNFVRKARWMESAAPGVFPAGNEEMIASLQCEEEKLFEKLKLLKPGDKDFEEAFAPLEERSGQLTEAGQNIVETTNRLWRKKLSAETSTLHKFITDWLDNWAGDLLDGDQRRRIEKYLTDIESYVQMPGQNVSFEMFQRESADFVQILIEAQEAHSFFAFIEKARSPINQYIFSRYFSDRFLQDKKLAGKEIRFSALPVFENGMLKDIEFIVTSHSPNDSFIVTTTLFEANAGRKVPPEIEIIMSNVRGAIYENFNSFYYSETKDRSDVPLSPFHFEQLVRVLLIAYVSFSSKIAALTYEEDLPGIRSIKIQDIILDSVQPITKTFRKNGDRVDSRSDLSFLKSKIEHLGSIKNNRPLTEDEERAEKTITRVLNSTRILADYGWFDKNSLRGFLKSSLWLLSRTTGEEYAVPEEVISFEEEPSVRPSLTFAPGTSRMSSAYPTLKEYRGVYLDAEKLSFEVSELDSSGKSDKLAKALNASLKYYLKALEKDSDMLLDASHEPWRVHLKSVLDYLKKRDGKVDIAVVTGLPVNSLVAVGAETILFDVRFIEFLITNMPTRAAPRLILGERIMHELGHMAKEDKVRHIANNYDRMVEAEVMQLETDVVLREKIYRSNPHLPHEVDKFVHEKVLPQDEKFSSAFNTAKLFANDNKWIAMYRRGDLEKMRSALRIFIIETLRGVSVSPYVRLFPNGIPAPEPIRPDEAPQTAGQTAAIGTDKVSAIVQTALKRHWYYRSVKEERARAMLEGRIGSLVPSFLADIKKLAVEEMKKDETIAAELAKIGHTLTEKDIVTVAGFGSYWYSEKSSDLDMSVVVKIPGIYKVFSNITVDPNKYFKKDAKFKVDKIDLSVSSQQYYDSDYLNSGIIAEKDIKEQMANKVMFWRDSIVLEGKDPWAEPPSIRSLTIFMRRTLVKMISLNRLQTMRIGMRQSKLVDKLRKRWGIVKSMFVLLFSDDYLGDDSKILTRVSDINKRLATALDENDYRPQSPSVDLLLRQAMNELERLPASYVASEPARPSEAPQAQTETIESMLVTKPELKAVLEKLTKKLSDKKPEEVKEAFDYVAGIYSTFKNLLKETRQPEEPKYIFMPLPGTLSDMKKFAKDILKANGFTNINIIFYDGTVNDLRRALSDTSDKKVEINPRNALAYIDKKELKGLSDEHRENLGVTFIKENVPGGGGQFSVGGHVVLALGVLDLISSDRAPDSDYWQLVLNLVRKISNNENKYEGITKNGFMQKIQMEELEIDLPPIKKETIDQNMRTLSIVEKAVGTSM